MKKAHTTFFSIYFNMKASYETDCKRDVLYPNGGETQRTQFNEGSPTTVTKQAIDATGQNGGEEESIVSTGEVKVYPPPPSKPT